MSKAQSKNPQSPSIFDVLQKATEIMASGETENGNVPNAYGEFGYDATNPIPTKKVYLGVLHTWQC